MRYNVEVRKTRNKGRGVFATKNFQKGDIIEVCPVIILNTTERRHCEKTILAYYMYPWRSTRTGVVVLGYGSVYNHSFDPNADWFPKTEIDNMTYKAIKPIKKGEEITVNYNGEPDDQTPIDWFKVEK